MAGLTLAGRARGPTAMNKTLVWDIPNRIFHWGFAGSITAAIAVGFLVDDEQPLFQLHMLFGMVALFLLIIRLAMGILGSRYSRFSSYPVHPRKVLDYLRRSILSKTELYAGNNPGSASAALLMFLIIPYLYVSGTGFGGETIAELHGFFAWVLLAVVVVHLSGLIWHTIRHRENSALAMVTGKKTGRQEDSISSASPLWGVIILLVSVLWIAALFAGHNTSASTVKLPLIDVTVQLGENESDGGDEERDHDDDD